jgi:wyosine [tRNA(Phe)-imidazoG37] synthetase (radical SAM superfamily)
MNEQPKYIFGPVPSRRLGRSLGVDLAPPKTCPFDCVFCQLGRTTFKTVESQTYAPVQEIIAELRDVLDSINRPDYITLSGSGEPTLYASLDGLVAAIKERTDIPLAIITNGALFFDEDIRRACRRADVVLPTLAAPDEEMFQQIHRPCAGLTRSQHIAGLARFRDEYSGQIWLEIFLLEGMNSTAEHRAAIKRAVEQIRPDRVQLNTAVRPTSESYAVAVSKETLAEWARDLGPDAEIVADFEASAEAADTAVAADAVLSLCRRRPCTLDDIAKGLRLHAEDACRYVTAMLENGMLIAQWKQGGEFYLARDTLSE